MGGRASESLLRQFLIWRAGLFWFAVVLLGPAVIDLAALVLHVLFGGAAPDFGQPFARQIFGPSGNLWVLLSIFFLFGVLTNGEEIGWRGYAQSRLQARRSALVSSVVVGVVSAFWHIPKFLTEGSAQDYSFGLFLVDSIAKAVVLAWVYNSTGSSLLMVTLLQRVDEHLGGFSPDPPGRQRGRPPHVDRHRSALRSRGCRRRYGWRGPADEVPNRGADRAPRLGRCSQA